MSTADMPESERWRQAVRQEWADADVIAAWRKWYSQARLMIQDRLLTKGMGGLFPERADLSNLHRILDIGCGPGAWALDVADAYPVT